MKTLFIIFLIFLSNNLFGQQQTSKLKIGEKLPDIVFPVIINGGSLSHAKLSDFKGKLVILDYWNIWCTACLKGFPKMKGLQEQFSKEILILPVSFLHSKEDVEKFIERRKGTDGEIQLPLAVFESTKVPLFALAPTLGYPHVVWIGKDGRLLQTTSGSEVTEENIEKIINGDVSTLSAKNYQMNFNPQAPLLINGNGGPDTLFNYRSMITGSIDSIYSIGLKQSFDKKRTRLFIANQTAVELIKLTLYNGHAHDAFNKLVVFDGVLNERFIWDTGSKQNKADWLKANTYCYELILPGGTPLTRAIRYMHTDIDRYFGVKSSIQERTIECMALVCDDTTKLPQSTDKQPKNTFSLDKLDFKLIATTTSELVSFISNRNAPLLLDETGYAGKIDVDMKTKKGWEPEYINHQLKRYGLRLIPAKRTMKVVVIEKEKGET